MDTKQAWNEEMRRLREGYGTTAVASRTPDKQPGYEIRGRKKSDEKIRAELSERPNLANELVLMRVALDAIPEGTAGKEVYDTCYKIALQITGKTDDEISALVDYNEVQQQQVRNYVMCRGGLMGIIAAERPTSFFVDQRITGIPVDWETLKAEVEKVKKLRTKGESLPKTPDIYSGGLWR